MPSYRELWLWLGAACLTLATGFIGIALAYFTKQTPFSLYTSWQFISSIVFFAMAFAWFGAAAIHWVPPWIKARFPEIKMVIYGFGSYETRYVQPPDPKEVHARIISFQANITNMEREQNANLTIALRLVPAESYAVPIRWTIDPALSLNPLPRTINLPPGTTMSGDLVFEILNPPSTPRPIKFELIVTDHVSDIRMATEPFTPGIKIKTADMHPYEEHLLEERTPYPAAN